MQRAAILVVDDELSLCALIREALVASGWEVLTAHDGEAALRLAREARPALIISDVAMPALDGWELCHQLRMDPDLADTPLILLSGLGEAPDRAIGLNLGADDYVAKPVDLLELTARVRTVLRRRGGSADVPLAGELAHMSLCDLLPVLEMNLRSGIVEITALEGTGQLLLHGGKIVGGWFNALVGRAACLAAIPLRAGRFRFRPIEVPPAPAFGTAVELIVEALVRADETPAKS